MYWIFFSMPLTIFGYPGLIPEGVLLSSLYNFVTQSTPMINITYENTPSFASPTKGVTMVCQVSTKLRASTVSISHSLLYKKLGEYTRTIPIPHKLDQTYNNDTHRVDCQAITLVSSSLLHSPLAYQNVVSRELLFH